MITCLSAWITLNDIIFAFSLKYPVMSQLIQVFPTNFKGILCIGFLKRAREEKETAKDRVVKDLQVSFFTGQFHKLIGE